MIFVSMGAIGILSGLFSCPVHEPALININLIYDNLVINNSYSKTQLEYMNRNSISPTHNGDFPLISGLTSSNITISNEAFFSFLTNSLLKKSCLWVDELNINIKYAPVMYISNSYQPNSCRYGETKNHELKHVKVDVETLEAYKNYLKQSAELAVKNNENIITSSDNIDATQKIVSQRIADAVQYAVDIMRENLKTRQRQVDTRAEYERLSNICPHEPNM